MVDTELYIIDQAPVCVVLIMPVDVNSYAAHVLPVVEQVQPYTTINVLSNPIFVTGAVVKGFGRGSKLLGYPTANLDPNSFTTDINSLISGVYCGWCMICDTCSDDTHNTNNVYKTVLSIGTNPTFPDSIHKTVECYILHKYSGDFYNSTLHLCIAAFLRPQEKYNSMDQLMNAIHNDELIGNDLLNTNQQIKQLQRHSFFTKYHNSAL